MIVQEIVRTCSNPHVARAAVASIGGDFAQRFSRDAAKRNLTKAYSLPASFAASRVKRVNAIGRGSATRRAARTSRSFPV